MTAAANTDQGVLPEGEPSELARWIAADALRCFLDIGLPNQDWALIHAHLVLGRPALVDAFAAVDQLADTRRRLAAVAGLHQPRAWADGQTVVCRHCERAWPCATVEALGS